MKKSNYLLIGIVIVVIVIALVTIVLISQKKIPDSTPIIKDNDSNVVNPSIVVKNDSITNDLIVANVSGNYNLNLKVKNPQYKQGSEIFFIYEIQNLENNTLNIPKNIAAGIEIKDSVGTPAESYDSSDKLVILKEDLSLSPLQKSSYEFSIKGDDFELTGLNPVEGSYYAVIINIGNVKSNKAMVRILK